MKMKKFILALLLAGAALFGVCGCVGPGTPPGDTTAPAEETDAPAALIDLADYIIIRAEEATDAEKKCAVTLYDGIAAIWGAGNRIKTDWIKRGEQLPAEGREILVGPTNRPESAEVLAGLKENDYAIRYFPASGRIVIAGGGPEATMKAVEKFMEDFLTGEKPDGKYTIPETLNVLERDQYDVTRLTLNGVEIGQYTLVLPQKADRDETYAAQLIREAVKKASGTVLTSVRETEAVNGARIFIGATAPAAAFALKGADAGCLLGASGADILVGGDGGMTVRAAREFVAAVVPQGCTGERDVTLPAASVTPRETPGYSALPELGEMPVALTDQKNAVAAVYDLAPALTVGQAKLVWTFAPTTANGFSTSGYGNRIDEAKLRYSTVLGKYVILVTSSSGFVGVGEYPSGVCVWCGSLNGYGPHSIEYLPNGNVALALSGNGDEEKSFIRVYAASQGKNNMKCASAKIESAHAVQWDDVRGILWALGSKTVTAYEIGGTDDAPTLTRLSCYDATASMGGHDMAPVLGDTDKLWLSGNAVYLFDKSLGTIKKYEPLSVSGSTKSIGTFPDGTAVRAVASNVYASHDTDALTVFTPDTTPDTYSGRMLTFAGEGRAFYKARIFLPFYS